MYSQYMSALYEYNSMIFYVQRKLDLVLNMYVYLGGIPDPPAPRCQWNDNLFIFMARAPDQNLLRTPLLVGRGGAPNVYCISIFFCKFLFSCFPPIPSTQTGSYWPSIAMF